MTCPTHKQQQCCPIDKRVKEVQRCLHKLSHNSDARRRAATTLPAKCANWRHISFTVSSTHTSHATAQAISRLVLLRATRVQSQVNWRGVYGSKSGVEARQFPFNRSLQFQFIWGTSVPVQSVTSVPIHLVHVSSRPIRHFSSNSFGASQFPFNRALQFPFICGTSVPIQSSALFLTSGIRAGYNGSEGFSHASP
jgi:hypothetical protein